MFPCKHQKVRRGLMRRPEKTDIEYLSHDADPRPRGVLNRAGTWSVKKPQQAGHRSFSI